MNIEWFHGFLEASRLKSLSKASEKLNMTQPALSKQLRNLEEFLEVELFTRTAKGVELTEAGALLQKRIQPILSEINSLREDLLNLEKLSYFRIGTLPSLAAYYLPHRLFKMAQQGIHIDLKVLSTSGEILDLLQNGSLDAGIVQKSPSISKSYWLADLFQEPFLAIIPNVHPFYRKDSITMDDLKDEPLIVYPNKCDVRTSILEAYNLNQWTPNFSVEVSFGESIPGFVAAGAGISILPEIIATHLSHDSLKAIPIIDFGITRTTCLVSPKRSLGNKVHRYLVIA